MAYHDRGSGPPHFDVTNYSMWEARMEAFLRGNGQLLWDVTIYTTYVIPTTFVALGSRDQFEANSRSVDFLICALSKHEFNHVLGETLACKIWDKLKVAHRGDSQVKARLFSTYRREYDNFTHLPMSPLMSCFNALLAL